MNIINFNQSDGFPLETEILDEMQKSWSIFNALGNIVGDKKILTGCVTTGTNVSDGVIYLNGEVLEFRGGFLQDNIIIQEDITSLEFEDLSMKEVVKVRYATFGSAVTSYAWSEFSVPNFLRKVPLAYSFDFINLPAASFLLTHNLGTLNYNVVGEFVSDVSSPSNINDVACYAFTVWQKTPTYCYVKIFKLTPVIPGGNMKANFKIIY